MPKIDFYLIPEAGEKERMAFACRLVEKIHKQQRRIYIHTDNPQAAYEMDELLWTYREDSFLPHNLYGEGPDPAPPIQIGFDKTPDKHRDVLINLSITVPEFYHQFARILELVSNNTAATDAGRERYKLYRSKRIEITTHKLTTSTEV